MSVFCSDTRLIFCLNIDLNKSNAIGTFWSFMYARSVRTMTFLCIIFQYLANGGERMKKIPPYRLKTCSPMIYQHD